MFRERVRRLPKVLYLGHGKQTSGTPQPASCPQLSGVERDRWSFLDCRSRDFALLLKLGLGDYAKGLSLDFRWGTASPGVLKCGHKNYRHCSPDPSCIWVPSRLKGGQKHLSVQLQVPSPSGSVPSGNFVYFSWA